MAKAKKTTKAQSSKRKAVTVRKSVFQKPVDNKLSIALIIFALIVFVLAAVSMGG